MSKTYITMTTIKNRFPNLEHIVPVLCSNADTVFIKVCGTIEYPDILNKYPNIDLEVTEDRLGSEQKFHGFKKIEEDGYMFTCDDDILYTDKYFKTMKNTIDKYDKQCGASLHAGRIDFTKRTSGYWKHRGMFSMYRPLETDQICNIICSVTAGYHTSTFKIFPEDCNHSQMDDVFATVELTIRDLKMISPARVEGLIKQLPSGGYAIHANKGGSGGHQYEAIDKLINAHRDIMIDYQKRHKIFGG